MTPESHIARDTLVEMFEGIRRQTGWNIDGDMLWGYFFVDDRADRLQLVRRDLEQRGYRFVDLWEVKDDGTKTGKFVLHVEKVEAHTVDSLDVRNRELIALARKHGVMAYDGMDVGPATDPAPPATRPHR